MKLTIASPSTSYACCASQSVCWAVSSGSVRGHPYGNEPNPWEEVTAILQALCRYRSLENRQGKLCVGVILVSVTPVADIRSLSDGTDVTHTYGALHVFTACIWRSHGPRRDGFATSVVKHCVYDLELTIVETLPWISER